MTKHPAAASESTARYVRRHLLFGWASLFAFLSLGMVLEVLHGLKVGWYLDVTNESRRLMLTLCHAHGSLLALVHVLFALTIQMLRVGEGRTWVARASATLIGSTVLLPGGFFLGGLFIYGGDPGIGIFLAPVGGLLFAAAVLLVILGVRGERAP